MQLLYALAILAFPTLQSPPSQHDRYGTELPPARYSGYPDRPVLRLTILLRIMTPVCDISAFGSIYFGCTKADPLMVNDLLHNPYLPRSAKTRVERALLAHKNTCVVLVPEVAGVLSYGYQWSVFYHELGHCHMLYHGLDGHGWYNSDGEPAD